MVKEKTPHFSLCFGPKMDPEAVSAFNSNLRRCQVFGWWKTDSTSPTKKFAYALYRSLSVAWLVIFTFLQLADLSEASSGLEEFSTNVCGTSVSVISTFKVIAVIRKSRHVENLSSSLMDNLSVPHVGRDDTDRMIMRLGSSKILKMTKMFFGLVIPTVLGWCLVPFIDRTGTGLPLRLWMPYDWHFTPGYQIFYCYQVVGLWVFAVAIVSHDLVIFGFIIQICCHYDILEKNIRKLGGSVEGRSGDGTVVNKEKVLVSEIRKSIIHHQEILKRIKKLQMIYQECFVAHFAGGVPLLCVIGFDIITAGRKTGISPLMVCRIGYVWSSLFDIFFYCYFGEHLRQKGLGIAKAVYESRWYRMGKIPRKMLLTMLLRAQSSPELNVGGLHPINLPAFLSLLRMTYNILALMVQMSR